MRQLEPTYLRYIYGGLVNGIIHQENTAELPDGLIGLYEEAFSERKSVGERQKLLQRFAIWALLKKEVSAAFVAEVLGETEDDIQQFIFTYSAWFNSPEIGKYQLYHKRLKVYLLQKLSEKKIHALHEKLIVYLEKAINDQKVDEFEYYSLEYLAVHFSVSAMLYGDEKKLVELAYSQTHWERQLKISKGYSWTKIGFKAVMTWASKYNDVEVVECGLKLIDLYHKEQNAAPQIVTLVTEGDIDSALKRIEEFGSNNKEGLQRKFILYMLCLMELTLLESKDKSFQKSAIEKLLNHLDEQLPSDHSILIWNDIFPSYLVFLMSCEWAAHGLNYLIVFKRTNTWKHDWIREKCPYNDGQLEVLMEGASSISDETDKSSVLKAISAELTKQGKITESLDCTSAISNEYYKSIALMDISTELAKRGKVEESAAVMQDALNSARGISEKSDKSSALSGISTELAKRGKIEESAAVMQDALNIARGISLEILKGSALKDISTELAKQGKIAESLDCAHGIGNGFYMSSALSDISTELAKRGKIEESAAVMQDAFDSAHGISGEKVKSTALTDISTELAKRGKIEEANDCTHGISNGFYKSNSIRNISTELAKQGKIEEAIDCARGIDDEEGNRCALLDISTELAKQGKIAESDSLTQESLDFVRGISDESDKSSALMDISTALLNQGKVAEADSVIQEALECAHGISYELAKSYALMGISTELAKQGKVAKSLDCARGISLESDKSNALADISTELAKQGKIAEAIDCARGISDEYYKSISLTDISTELAKQGKITESDSLMQEALEYARSISDESDKSNALADISTELAKQGYWNLAESIGMEITQLNSRYSCWQILAHNANKDLGWQKSLAQVNEFENDEVRLFYLKGWADATDLLKVDEACVKSGLIQLVDDSKSLEILLQKHALHQAFFGGASKQKLNRLNSTLNFQWALDLS
jgi:predicted phage gp36 major capsid-like protein